MKSRNLIHTKIYPLKVKQYHFFYFSDVKEINDFLLRGCGCSLGENGTNCIKQFSANEISVHLLNTRELERDQLDLVILGQLLAFRSSTNKITYMHRSKTVCRKAFLFLNGIGEKRLRHLRGHFMIKGVTARIHGNKNKRPHNVTDEKTVEKVKTFISNLSVSFGMSLPGRVAGQRDFRVNVLPSTHTYSYVYKMYIEACKSIDDKFVSYQVFCQLWKTFHPDVIAM